MKEIQLCERDRLIIRIAAVNGRSKSREDLRAWIKAAEAVGLDNVPLDKNVSEANTETFDAVRLEDAQHDVLKRVLEGMAEWPWALAAAVTAAEDGVNACKEAKVEEPQKKA